MLKKAVADRVKGTSIPLKRSEIFKEASRVHS